MDAAALAYNGTVCPLISYVCGAVAPGIKPPNEFFPAVTVGETAGRNSWVSVGFVLQLVS